MVILLDTSIFIEYSRRKSGPFISLLREQAKTNFSLSASTITTYEFWSGKSMILPESKKKAEKLFEDIELLAVTSEIAKTAGELVREGRCQGNDALIAATALEVGAQLVTLNTKHFKNVPGLKLWHPKSTS